MNHKNLFRFVMLALSWAAVPVCAAAPPSSNFDLSHWKLTLPVDAAGGTTGEAMEIKTPQLTAGYASDYFYSGADNAMVFWCPVIGARTSNATYPRSELRELIDGRNSDVNWSGNGTHVLDARCKVTQLPSTGKVIIGQVHGYDTSPLIKIQVRSGRFEGLVKDHIANDTETKFDLGAFALNSLITYQIKVVDGIAFITVNGTTRSFDFFASDPAWKAIGFYFKAGAYVQDNSGPITEGGRMAFTYLAAAHSTVVGEPPTISTQPLSQTVNEGSPVSLSVVANGSATLSYQWRKNGVNLPNAVAATFSLMSAKTNDAGIYTVAVANSFGAVTSAVATLVVHATNVVVPPTTPPAVAISLSDALDTTGLTWTTNGSPAWFGQTNVNHDGSDSAQSGAIGHSKTTSMQTTVQGPGTVSFWWKVSSQPSDDRLLFYVGSSEKARITGEVDWQFRTLNIGSGSQVLKWTYSKNSSRTGGLDRAWVDQVRFGIVPPTITAQPADTIVDLGKTAKFTVVAAGTPIISYRWLFNGTPLSDGNGISGATTTTLTIANMQTPRLGIYSVVLSNSAGSVTSAVARLQPGVNVSFAQALDGAGMSFSYGGKSQPWQGQLSTTAHDGVDAAQSGAIEHSEYNYLKTEVRGPGTLIFWWKVSSEQDRDYLRFIVEGDDVTRISGESGWQQVTYQVEESDTQELQWRYSKNSSMTAGQDRAWLDQVEFVASARTSAVPVVIAPEPIVAAVIPSGDEMLVTWNAEAGKTYEVSSTEDFADTAWTILAGGVAADGSTGVMLDNRNAAQRFYRVTEE